MYNLKQGKTTMYVNSLSSLQQRDPPLPGEGALRHHCGDYDLKQLNFFDTDKLEERNMTIYFRHAKVHQDETKNRKKNK